LRVEMLLSKHKGKRQPAYVVSAHKSQYTKVRSLPFAVGDDC